MREIVRMSLSHWLVVMTLATQAGTSPAAAPTPALPEPVVSRQSLFTIPFQVRHVNDPARQPVELQLYVSGDRGAHWNLYAKAPPTQQHFTVPRRRRRRVLVRHSHGRPLRPSAARNHQRAGAAGGGGYPIGGVETRAPRGPGGPATSSANAAIQPQMPSPVVNSAGSRASADPPRPPSRKVPWPSPSIRRSAIAIPAADDRAGNAAAIPGLPPGERPRMVNSRLFELEYDVDSVGPSGIGRVELWGTRDAGKTWRRFAVDNNNRSPLLVSVDEEGIYGFRVVVTNGAGLGGAAAKRRPARPLDRRRSHQAHGTDRLRRARDAIPRRAV